jgi:hypothetical protein
MRRRAIVDCWGQGLRSRLRAGEGRDQEEIQRRAGRDKEAEEGIGSGWRGLHQEQGPGRGIGSSSGPP